MFVEIESNVYQCCNAEKCKLRVERNCKHAKPHLYSKDPRECGTRFCPGSPERPSNCVAVPKEKAFDSWYEKDPLLEKRNVVLTAGTSLTLYLDHERMKKLDPRTITDLCNQNIFIEEKGA